MSLITQQNNTPPGAGFPVAPIAPARAGRGW